MRSTARALLSSLGLVLHRLARGRTSAARILYYHSIGDGPVRSSVSPAAFRLQMEYLVTHRYHVLPLSEIAEHVATRTPFPDRSVALTLDDGFEDNYSAAYPVLEEMRFPATIFLVAGYVGTGRLPTLTRTDFVPRPLSWEQVKEMYRHGVEFGSHTLTHPMLSRIDLEAARREIGESKRVIEEALGAPILFFCYPRGDFNDAVRQVVRDAGYRGACTTVPGLNGPTTDLFALRRTYVSRQDTVGEFAKKLAGAYDVLQQMLRVWRGLRAR